MLSRIGLQFVRRNRFANGGINLIGEAGGFFDAQPGTRPEVQTNLSGVDLGKEISAEKGDEADRENAKYQETAAEQFRPVQSGSQPVTVAFSESLEAMLEFLLVAAEEALLFANMLFRFVFVRAAQEDTWPWWGQWFWTIHRKPAWRS